MRRAAAGGVTLAVLLLLIAGLAGALAAGHGPAVRVAFLRGGDVHLLDLGSGAETRLTIDGAALGLRWTPDGRALFVRTRTGPRRWRPGGAAEEVRDGVWSPDGAAVAFAQPLPGGEPGSAVWVEEAGQRRRLTAEERWADWGPLAWSPDGQRLALSRIRLGPSPVPGSDRPYPGEGALVLVDRSGGGRRDVPLPREWDGAVRSGQPDDVLWAPSGDRLAVWVGPPNPCPSCRADGAPVLVVDARTGQAQPVGTALGTAVRGFGALSWASDGRFVVLSTGTVRETYWDKHLARVDLPAGTRTDLARDDRYADTQPAVSPDGRRIAFARGWAQVDGRPQGPIDPDLHPNVATIASRRLWLVGADGAGARQLQDAPGWTDDAPTWTPDGRWIVFVRWRPPKPTAPAAVELWATRPDGSDARRLAPLSVPANFTEGFGFYGAFPWRELFAVAPR
jgi:dipeptidyl aminopeptidase/acylaminoacyl peptidase